MPELKLDTPEQAWVYLNRVVEGPSPTLAALLDEFEPEKIAHGIYNRADWLGKLRDETAARHDWLRQEEDIAAAHKVGARLITKDCPEWPGDAFARSFRFYASGMSSAPASFDAEAVAPHSLWVRGDSLGPLVEQAVAIVGTRAISRYGYDATRQITSQLAQHRWTIVSGGALGVDSVAHEAALEAGGLKVGVAACGIDYDYPARNSGLFSRICAGGNGAIVSEFPPGTTPQRHRFLTRNRLVAALTSGTVCVEAAYRSGALNTMNWAEALGKVAMAVPGPITGAGSVGCHLRIQEGRAQLVTGAEGIRELLSAVGEVDAEAQLEMDFGRSLAQSLSRNELKVFGSTPPPEDEQWARADDIARDCGLRVALVIHLLVELERRGVVARRGGQWKRTTE